MIATVPSLDLFAPGSAGVMVLLGARVGGLLLVAPVFSARTVPMSVRTGLLVLLTLLLQPAALSSVAAAAPGAMPQVTLAAALAETLVGFAIGFGAAVLVGAVEVAGDLMTTTIGLSGAAIFDPLNGGQVPVLGHFMNVFVITLLLAFDAHLVMVDAVAASAHYLPLGSAVQVTDGLRELLALGGTLFVLGLRFAAPVIAAVMVANAALAVLGRAAPALNILSLAFPLQIGIGLFALAASVPLIATFFTSWDGAYDSVLTTVLGARRAGPAGGGAR